MAQGPDGKTIIIVKKVVGHGGHHGGSWKVAFADFVTSMMCFFMVLWLVNSASIQTRERIASYFRAPGVFEKGSGTPTELGGAGILPDTFAPPADQNSQVTPDKQIYVFTDSPGEEKESSGNGGEKELESVKDGEAAAAAQQQKQEEAFNTIKKEIDEKVKLDQDAIAEMLGRVEVKVDQRGLHIEIMESPKASMFASGSADILSGADAELTKIAAALKKLPNPIDIEGHTDAAPYRSANSAYDNWSLSTDRANSARRVLLRAGIKESQIARVIGYAAQRPKVPADPLHSSNRRISISMRFTELAAQALAGTQAKETRPVPLNPQLRKDVEARKSAGTAPVLNGGAVGTASGLKVEVSTTAPEGEPITESSEAPSRPVWIEKDKIFGDNNPFLGQ